MTGFTILLLAIAGTIYWLYKGGFDYIKKTQSKKNKKDSFNWDTDVNKVAGRDSWDESLYDEIF
jgi:hypothetical protein